jgi:hypothetical protein
MDSGPVSAIAPPKAVSHVAVTLQSIKMELEIDDSCVEEDT